MADISFMQLEDSKTKAMNLSKMIFHLLFEHKDDDDHKYWCDMEKEMSNASNEGKDEKTTMFKKKVAEYAVAIKTFIKAITENNDKAADIIKHMEEETALKNGNHAENFDNIKDSQDAQAALQATQGFKDDKAEQIKMFISHMPTPTQMRRNRRVTRLKEALGRVNILEHEVSTLTIALKRYLPCFPPGLEPPEGTHAVHAAGEDLRVDDGAHLGCPDILVNSSSDELASLTSEKTLEKNHEVETGEERKVDDGAHPVCSDVSVTSPLEEWVSRPSSEEDGSPDPCKKKGVKKPFVKSMENDSMAEGTTLLASGEDDADKLMRLWKTRSLKSFRMRRYCFQMK